MTTILASSILTFNLNLNILWTLNLNIINTISFLVKLFLYYIRENTSDLFSESVPIYKFTYEQLYFIF